MAKVSVGSDLVLVTVAMSDAELASPNAADGLTVAEALTVNEVVGFQYE